MLGGSCWEAEMGCLLVREECQHTQDLISLFCYGTASPGLAFRHPLPPGSSAPHISHQHPPTLVSAGITCEQLTCPV